MPNFDLMKTYVLQAPSAQALFDRDMRYLAYSPRWVEDYGLDPDVDYRGRSHYDVFPEIGDDWRATHQRCLDGHVERTELDAFPRADGRTQWLRYEVRAWHQADGSVGGLVMLTENLTEQVEAERRAKAEAGRLRRLLDATGTQGDFQTRTRAVLSAMADMLGLESGLLARVEGGVLMCLAGYSACGETLCPGDAASLAETYCDLPMSQGELVAIDHMAESEHRGHPCYDAMGLEAYIGVPVHVDGAAYGSISFGSATPAGRPFSDADRELVRLAGQWAGALLEREVREREAAAQAERLHTLADAFALRTVDDEEALAGVVDELRSLIGLDIGIVSRVDLAADRYEVVACAVPGGSELTRGDVFALGQTYCAITLAASDVVSIYEMKTSEHRGHPCYEAFGLESYIGAPVLVNGRPWGTLNFSAPEARPRSFTDADRDLVRLAARWVGGLIETSQEIEARAEAERVAEAAAAELALVQRAMPDALVFADVDRRIVRMNPAFSRLFGYSPEDVVGKKTCVLYGAREDFGTVGRSRFNPQGAVNLVPYEVDYRRADGSTFRGETVGTPVRDGAGALVGYVAVIRDVTERRALEDRLYHQATHDDLTGLANRALFTERLGAAVQQDRRADDFAVLYLDLDRFKAVNDTLGHSAGDALLQGVAERLLGSVRPTDTVGRLGGDEFAILLDGLPSPDFAVEVAVRIRAALESPVNVGGEGVEVGASVGVVVGRPDHREPDAVLREADLAMYKAKRGGFGLAAVYQPSDVGRTHRRLRLERDLPRAVEQGELQLAYQPIVRLADGELAGFEALVRWDHPEFGLLYPDAFIGAAEESGLVVAVDEWVLLEACRQMVAWDQQLAEAGAPEGSTRLFVNVNCTGRDLLQSSYTAAVRGIRKASGFSPDRLLLEITESLLVDDTAAVAGVLRGLQGYGVRFCIDDFGTGYSSLATLHRLPVDRIKVDRSFVADLSVRSESAALVETIVRLGAVLGKGVVAEGVETPSHLAALRQMDCAYGQGYLFAKPLRPVEVEGLLSESAAGGPPWRGLWAPPAVAA